MRRKNPFALVRVLDEEPDPATPAEDVTPLEPLPPFEGVTFSVWAEDEEGRPKVDRPRKPIDLAMLQRLAALPGITEKEIAGVCGVSEGTFSRRKASDPEFRTAVESGQAAGKNRVRVWQARHLESGDAEMAKWLGIQLLDQRRNPETVNAPPEVGGKSELLDTLERLEAGLVMGRVADDAAAKGESDAGV